MFIIFMMGFKSWLHQFRVSKGERYTHLGMQYFTGSYYIPEERISVFHKKYYEHVFTQSGKCDLIESHKELCCLIYDIDLTIPKENYNTRGKKQRGYTQESIMNFIQAATKIAAKYVEAPCSSFDAFVLEKDKATVRKDKVKDGVHIMFPYIVTVPAIQHLFREELLVLAKHMFENATNDIEDIIDAAIIERNGWMMMGSAKKEGDPYKLTGIYQYHSDDDVGETSPIRLENSEYYTSSLNLVEFLSIRRFTMADLAVFKEEKNTVVESYIQNYEIEKAQSENIHNRQLNGDNPNLGFEPNLSTIKQLVSILSSERADNFNAWIELGWCLHNISPNLFETWVSFSERSPKYESQARASCDKQWDKMRNTGLGVGTLHMWAKKDNPMGYVEIVQNDLEHFICKMVSSSSHEKDSKGNKKGLSMDDIIYHVVTVLKQKVGPFFVCSNYERREWWEFDGNLWNPGDGDIGLKLELSENLYQDFMNVSTKFKRLAELKKGQPNYERYDAVANDTYAVAQKLKTARFRKQVLEEAAEQFYWNREKSAPFDSIKFEEILNTDKTLVALKNGVFDLERCIFRESRCEDYISLCTGTDWKEYHWNDPIIEELQDFLKQILPKKEVRDYVLQVLATSLDGRLIAGEHVHIWVGSGGNGKSKLIELYEYAFGRYCAKLPIAALTGKRASASAPQPEIARLVGKRFVVLQEPNEREQIQVGVMKEYSGGDKITVRTLHKEPFDFFPQFTMFLTCNQLPKVPADDGGTWRRIRVVKFTSKFVDDPDPECEDEFPIDYDLARKLKSWSQPFFWLLTEHYKIFKEKGMKEPEDVLSATNEYKEMNDNFSDFIIEHIEKDIRCSLELGEIYSIFQLWFKKTISDKPPSRKELQQYLERKWGPASLSARSGKKGWKGMKLREHKDEQTHMIFDDENTTESVLC